MDNIKITLGKIETILQATDSLDKISNLQKKSLPAKLRYWVNKGLDLVIKEKNRINETKNEIFEQYGDKDNEGKLIKTEIGNDKFIPKLSSDNLKKVTEELKILMEEEVDFGFRKVVIDSNLLPNLDGFEMEFLSIFYVDTDEVKEN